MAVSQMQKLSLILPKDDLDGLLLALQSEAKIQIYDLSEHEEWQAAFEANTLSQPLTENNRQALVELQKRQEQVEKMIQTLEPYMPEKKALQALKEEPLSLSFDDLQAHGMIRDEDLLLTKLKRQLRVLDKARQKIADAKGEIERLEKWRPLEVTPAALATFHYVHGLIGTIPNSDTDAVRSSLKAHPELELEEVFTSETEHGYVILYRSGDRVAVQELLEDHGFKELDYEEEQVPAAYLDRLEGEIKEQEAVVAATLAELQNSQKELDQLKYQMDYLLSLGAREEAKSLLASTQSLVALEGWIETSQVASLRDFLQVHDELTLSVLQRYHHISNVTESLVKDSQLDRVAELIDQVDRVYFFGIGSSGLVAREMKLRFMRLGVVCEALTDQDGFAWTTSILDSSCLVIGFSLSGGTNSITDNLLDAKEKGAKTVLVTANPAAIHQGFTEVLPAAPLPSSTYIDRISTILPLLIVVDLIYAHFLNKSREQKEIVFNSYWENKKLSNQRSRKS